MKYGIYGVPVYAIHVSFTVIVKQTPVLTHFKNIVILCDLYLYALFLHSFALKIICNFKHYFKLMMFLVESTEIYQN